MQLIAFLQVHVHVDVCEELSSGRGFNLTLFFKRTKQAMTLVFAMQTHDI